MKEAFGQVWDFHNIFNCYKSDYPELPSDEIRDLRKRLLKEEYEEFLEAEDENDLVGIADALADIMYIVLGTAVSYGIPIDEVFDEVHRSNMSKVGEDGKPIHREDGKILKGKNYFKPDIVSILEKHKRNSEK